MWLFNAFPLPNFAQQPMNKKATKRFAAWENDLQLQEVFIYLTNLYLNVFKWEGLPSTCNERALERTLFFYGKALFFWDDEISNKAKLPVNEEEGERRKFYHTPVTLDEGINIYWEHIKRTAFSYEFLKTYDQNNSVIIRANRMMYPPFITYQIYSQKIVDSARTIDVVSRNMKLPFIVTAEEGQVTTFEEVFKKVYNNEQAIFGTNTLNPDSIQVIQTGSSQRQLLPDVWEHKHNVENEVFTRLGIDNAHTDKRERLLTDEVNANNGIIEQSIGIELEARQEACKEINDLFGLNISVNLRYKQEEVQNVSGDMDTNKKQSNRLEP